jgi:hypothetical protein
MVDITFGNLGDVEPGDFRKEPINKSAVAIGPGLALRFDNTITPNTLRIAVAGDDGPFFVSDFIGAASTDVVVSAYAYGKIAMKANGAIQPFNDVVADAGGLVKAKVAEADSKVIGTYVGHFGEGTGTQTATAAAANDTVWILVNKK